MKVILSRKGFDSKYGGGPSPIIDGERICSLPIPYASKETRRTFEQLRFEGKNVGSLIERLYRGRRTRSEFCHLDPDLRRDALPVSLRGQRWRPIFGQQGRAAAHLMAKEISRGDIFLFFGLFRESYGWDAFVPAAPNRHVIHGWLQVEDVVQNPASWVRATKNRWAASHPHAYGDYWEAPNILFTSTPQLIIQTERGWQKTSLPGAGAFSHYHERLCLSDQTSRHASHWRIPKCLRPNKRRRATITHLAEAKWSRCGDGFVRMDPGPIRLWQEAVITGNPEAANWAIGLIDAACQ